MTEFWLFQSLTEITEVIVIVTLLSGLFLGSVLYVLMRRGLLRRVEQLYVGSEAIGRGNLDYRIPSLGDDEIGDLGESPEHHGEKPREDDHFKRPARHGGERARTGAGRFG